MSEASLGAARQCAGRAGDQCIGSVCAYMFHWCTAYLCVYIDSLACFARSQLKTRNSEVRDIFVVGCLRVPRWYYLVFSVL